MQYKIALVAAVAAVTTSAGDVIANPPGKQEDRYLRNLPSMEHIFVDGRFTDMDRNFSVFSIGSSSGPEIRAGVQPKTIRYITIKSGTWFASYRVELIGYGPVSARNTPTNSAEPESLLKFAKTESRIVD